MSDPIVIVSVARTPMGVMMGSLSGFAAHQLGAIAIKAAVERAGLAPDQVNEVIMGNVLQAGQGQAPARQAALGAGLPLSVACTTVHKVCGSGMKAAMFGHDMLKAGSTDVVVAGGQESMSNAPYLLLRGRQGYRYGHSTVYDHMALDGLEDAYDRGKAMGVFAEICADKYEFTRELQDAFALESLKRARAATEDGSFKWEIASVTVAGRKGDTQIDTDESPQKAMPEKIPTLKPAFKKDGTVTAANASSISDGAAALVMMRESTAVSLDEQPARGDASKIPTLKPAFAKDGTITAANASSISDGAAALVMTRASVAERLGLDPIARVVASAGHAHSPALFTTAPVFAMRKALEKAGWSTGDVDLFEVNEAFACVAMIAMHDLGLSHDVVNINGGACALGHPIGASGARIMATLLSALQASGQKRGLASLCIGGGEATAMAVELLN